MGFFSRLGKKISGGLQSAGRLGRKVLGTVSRVGDKIKLIFLKVIRIIILSHSIK